MIEFDPLSMRLDDIEEALQEGLDYPHRDLLHPWSRLHFTLLADCSSGGLYEMIRELHTITKAKFRNKLELPLEDELFVVARFPQIVMSGVLVREQLLADLRRNFSRAAPSMGIDLPWLSTFPEMRGGWYTDLQLAFDLHEDLSAQFRDNFQFEQWHEIGVPLRPLVLEDTTNALLSALEDTEDLLLGMGEHLGEHLLSSLRPFKQD